MKKNELVKSMNLTFNKIGFQLQKKSPELLVAAGVVGVVVSAVMACQATPKALKVAEKTGDDMSKCRRTTSSSTLIFRMTRAESPLSGIWKRRASGRQPMRR